MQEGAHALGIQDRYSINDHGKSKFSNRNAHSNSQAPCDPGKPKRKQSLKKKHPSFSSSSSSSDKESRQRKEDHRRKKEEEKRRAEERVQNEAKNNRADTRYHELKSHLGRKKFRQGAVVMLILVSFASYFLILNLLNKNLFNNIISGVEDLHIMYGRLQCTEDVINSY